MGIEGYLRRVNADTVALIRQQAAEKNWVELERVQDEKVEWMHALLMNQEGAEDEDDEFNGEQPAEQYFPTVIYDWVHPTIDEGAGLIDARFFDTESSDTFVRRVAIFAFLKLIPPPGKQGICLADAGTRWINAAEKDASMGCGLMGDETPKTIVDRALQLGLVERIGEEEGHPRALPTREGGESQAKKAKTVKGKEGSRFPEVVPSSIIVQTQKGKELLQAVTQRNDTIFFWDKNWPEAAEQQSSASALSASTAPVSDAQPTLLGLPLSARAWIYSRLDCPSLCRMEMLCKTVRSSILHDSSAAAGPPSSTTASVSEEKPSCTSGIDAQALTPLGLLAWFVVHRRAWGNLFCTKTLSEVGYRKDAIRRHRRRAKINQQLYSAGGMGLGAEWHVIHFALGPAGGLILDNDEANTGKEMGGSGIPILAHTPEEVEMLYKALRAHCCADVTCECEQYGYDHDDENNRCPYHPRWDLMAFWEYEDLIRKAGVMAPRDLEDFDVGFTVRSGLLAFLKATVENKQGLLAWVW